MVTNKILSFNYTSFEIRPLRTYMYFVYGLISIKKRNWIYIGSTNNLRRRLSEHQNGQSTYTEKYLPLKLEFYIAVHSRIKARKLEVYLKKGSGKAFLKKRVLSDAASA